MLPVAVTVAAVLMFEMAVLVAGFLFSIAPRQLVKAFPLKKHDLNLTVVALGKEYNFFYPEIDYYLGEPYLKNAEEVVDGIFYDSAISPKNAEVTILPQLDYPFSFTTERLGKGIDKEDLLVKIDRALRVGDDKIYAKEIVLKPSVTTKDLQMN